MTVVVAHPFQAVADSIAAALRARLGVIEAVPVVDSSACIEAAREWGAGHAVVDLSIATGRESSLCSALSDLGVAVVAVTCADAPDPLALLESGAHAIVRDTDGLDEVVLATRAVLNGEPYVPTQLLGSLLRSLVDQRRARLATDNKILRLSPREQEVLRLLTAGADQREIASRLVISPHTAKTHIQRMLGKLEVRSRAEAIAFASTHGAAWEGEGPHD